MEEDDKPLVDPPTPEQTEALLGRLRSTEATYENGYKNGVQAERTRTLSALEALLTQWKVSAFTRGPHRLAVDLQELIDKIKGTP